ncbi:MAG: N-acyl homoserine lactonase family protein [Pseudomonadota bacterium]
MRRRLLSFAGLGALAVVGGCAYSVARPVGDLATPSPSPGPVTGQLGRQIRIHMFQTGWVAVKEEHKAFSGPSSLRIPAILASQSWTEWLPVTAFVIEHPEGLFVVDTGETARMLDPSYAACDPGTGMFYRRNLQFSLGEEDELGPQMRRAGLDPDRVVNVIMTHLHSDHMGGMRHFPRAEFLVSEAASGGHTGALMCRIPASLNLRSVALDQGQSGAFPASSLVTADGAITIVPTPGHARGHQSVIVQEDGVSVCLVGDAAFTLDQIETGEIGGIVDNVADTRASAAVLKRQYEDFDTVMLPTHDPENESRLRAI